MKDIQMSASPTDLTFIEPQRPSTHSFSKTNFLQDDSHIAHKFDYLMNLNLPGTLQPIDQILDLNKGTHPRFDAHANFSDKLNRQIEKLRLNQERGNEDQDIFAPSDFSSFLIRDMGRLDQSNEDALQMRDFDLT